MTGRGCGQEEGVSHAEEGRRGRRRNRKEGRHDGLVERGGDRAARQTRSTGGQVCWGHLRTAWRRKKAASRSVRKATLEPPGN